MTTGPGLQIVDLPAEQEPAPRRPPRRGLGVVMLLAVLLAVTAVAGSRPRAITGRGAAAPTTALPAVGSCLRWNVDPAAPLTPVAGSVARIDCRQTHQGQVLSAWRPGALDLADQRRACPSTRLMRDAGHPSSDSAPADWVEPTVVRSTVIVTAGPTRLDFQACVTILRWESGSYSLFSTDRALGPATGDRQGLPQDATLAWCLDDQRRSTSCQQPHSYERVGIYSTQGASVLPASTCQERARTVIGDPARVSGMAGPAVLTTYIGSTTEETLGGSADVTYLLCDVVTPAGRKLIDTVAGLGLHPLPLQ